MSLRTQFKTDQRKIENGFWYDVKDAPNTDGTIPGFRLARMSVSNPKYAKAIQAIAEQQANAEMSGVRPSDDADETRGVEMFCDVVCLEWRNFQPEDDGCVMEYSRKNALTVFADKAWFDLRLHLQLKAQERAGFLAEKIAKTVKN